MHLRRIRGIVIGSFIVAIFGPQHASGDETVTYAGGKGPGEGRRIVLLSGDEEYRSEEGLVQLAKILAFRHGFNCEVLFPINPEDGTINPDVNNTLPGAEALDKADAIVMGLRFRRYPDDVMQHFVDAYLRGVPIVAVRTSTHAFNYPDNSESKFAHYSWKNQKWPGGFGRQVLGETWVSHLGTNHKELTHGIVEEAAKGHPVLRSVSNLYAQSGAYHVVPPDDVTVLLRAEVLTTMDPDSPPHPEKNDPHRPLAWTRIPTNEAGNKNRVLCTTMGAGPDLLDENVRRLLVNGVFWGLKLDVPANADVRLVGDYQPTDYSFGGYRKGVRPDDLKMTADVIEK